MEKEDAREKPGPELDAEAEAEAEEEDTCALQFVMSPDAWAFAEWSALLSLCGHGAAAVVLTNALPSTARTTVIDTRVRIHFLMGVTLNSYGSSSTAIERSPDRACYTATYTNYRIKHNIFSFDIDIHPSIIV